MVLQVVQGWLVQAVGKLVPPQRLQVIRGLLVQAVGKRVTLQLWLVLLAVQGRAKLAVQATWQGRGVTRRRCVRRPAEAAACKRVTR